MEFFVFWSCFYLKISSPRLPNFFQSLQEQLPKVDQLATLAMRIAFTCRFFFLSFGTIGWFSICFYRPFVSLPKDGAHIDSERSLAFIIVYFGCIRCNYRTVQHVYQVLDARMFVYFHWFFLQMELKAWTGTVCNNTNRWYRENYRKISPDPLD